VRDLGAADVIECTDCAGMWLEPQAFARVQLEAESLPGVLPAAREEPPYLEVSDLRYIPCLVCGELMCRRQYRHHGAFSGIVVDLCRTHGIWLDQGELPKILDFVRARKLPGARGTARDGSGLDRAPERAARPARAERPAREAAREGREERDISVPDLLARLGVVLG
jgi:Zn-finger nucleic acid-binding protein